MRSLKILVAAASLMVAAGAAHAETVSFHTTLSSAASVPPNASTGTGMVMATVDTATKAFNYEVTYSGLTGPATAAHFHGPAAAGANGPPVVPVASPASPIKGTATLNDAQLADLLAGKWYFNVHTAANRGGEIRGQLTK